MITGRDKNILDFIEQNGIITIKQCSNLFYKDSKYGYDLARKRLKILEEKLDLFKAHRFFFCNEIIYVKKDFNLKKINHDYLFRINLIAGVKNEE